jgi:hypothetical protein
MKVQRPKEWPEKYERTNEEGAMKETFEAKSSEKWEDMSRRYSRGPIEDWRENYRAQHDREEIEDQFGGVFQGR